MKSAPKPGARATRTTGTAVRPAYLAPLVRSRQPVTNREWFEQRQRTKSADIFEGLFGKLLAKVRG